MNRLLSKKQGFLVKPMPFVLGLLLLWTSLPLSAQKISQTFFVNDWANVLSDAEEQALEKKIKAYEDSTSTQIAIVLLNHLHGVPIEKQALEIANDWGIGQKRKNNGILILVAIKDRKARIELGKGLTDRISNAEARKAVRHMTRPYFRNKEYYKGLNLGVDRMILLLNGQFKNSKLGVVFFFAVLGFAIWVFTLIIKESFPAELGIACLGVALLELYWMVNPHQGWLYTGIIIGWLGMLLVIWRIREYLKNVKWYKINIEKRIGEVKSRQFDKKYIPSEVENKLQESTQNLQQSRLKVLKNTYHDLYRLLNSPEKYLSLRPDLALQEMSKRLPKLGYHEEDRKWANKYINWLQDNLQEVLAWCNTLDLAKLSADEQARLDNSTELYQVLFYFVETRLKQEFIDHINNPKFLKKDREQTLQQLQSFYNTAIKKSVSAAEDDLKPKAETQKELLEKVMKSPAQLWKYDELAMLQKMAKMFGLGSAHKIVDKQKLKNKLSNRSLENIQKLATWKGFPSSSVVKTVQTSFYKSYKKWDEATEEGEQLYQLVAFYDAYIAKDLKQLIYKKSASKSSYSSSKKPSYSSSKKGSSYSSYNDYDDYGSSSGSSGSSWGGGSFGGGGGSDDW
jgi:uncharacterized membrane protein YgcG